MDESNLRAREYQIRKLPPAVAGAARLCSDLGYGWFEACIPFSETEAPGRFLYLRGSTGFCIVIDMTRGNVATAYSIIAFSRGCPPKSWAVQVAEFIPKEMPWLEPPTCSRATEIGRKWRATRKANLAKKAAEGKLTPREAEIFSRMGSDGLKTKPYIRKYKRASIPPAASE